MHLWRSEMSEQPTGQKRPQDNGKLSTDWLAWSTYADWLESERDRLNLQLEESKKVIREQAAGAAQQAYRNIDLEDALKKAVAERDNLKKLLDAANLGWA